MSETQKKLVGLMVHRTKQEAHRFAQLVISWLQERGVEVRLDREVGPEP